MHPHDPDPVPPELDALNDADLCAVCGSAWPCERAVLAEHNLAAL